MLPLDIASLVAGCLVSIVVGDSSWGAGAVGVEEVGAAPIVGKAMKAPVVIAITTNKTDSSVRIQFVEASDSSYLYPSRNKGTR